MKEENEEEGKRKDGKERKNIFIFIIAKHENKKINARL